MTIDRGHANDSLGQLSIAELMRLHRKSLGELRRRGVVRTGNAPQGDWAEFLVKIAYDGELAPNSEKGWDVRTVNGRLLQVKARVVGPAGVGSKITSPFRSWDFDAAATVLFDDDLVVRTATELPCATVQHLSDLSSPNQRPRSPTDPANLDQGST